VKTYEQIIASGSVVSPRLKLIVLKHQTSNTIRTVLLAKGVTILQSASTTLWNFNFPVYIPDDIKQQNFKIDTVDGQYRKIVYSKDPKKGTTGIYIKDIRVVEQSLADLALSMATSNLTQQQQETALKIFETGRHRIQVK
jgi:hypothetical protein